ncbi:hypothetical protein FQN54_005572 [Arachnomyces sp. PD_36]|nr:hypothetical protein FQN54_005572 [Arachnomyces sp. PD_36]
MKFIAVSTLIAIMATFSATFAAPNPIEMEKQGPCIGAERIMECDGAGPPCCTGLVCREQRPGHSFCVGR